VASPVPLPAPPVFTLSPELMALFNFFSLLITLVGSATGVGFYLERRTNLKLESQTNKIDKIDDKLGESIIAIRQDFKELKREMYDMERRICDSINSKGMDLERNLDTKINSVESKVVSAKVLEDERVNNIQKRIENMESHYHGSKRFSKGGPK
jgi:hypothetical protein